MEQNNQVDWRYVAFLENVIGTIRKTQARTISATTIMMAYKHEGRAWIERAIEEGWLYEREGIQGNVYGTAARTFLEGKNTRGMADMDVEKVIRNFRSK